MEMYSRTACCGGKPCWRISRHRAEGPGLESSLGKGRGGSGKGHRAVQFATHKHVVFGMRLHLQSKILCPGF